jgi:DNA-binding MarR family transcriptional regulator
MNRDLITQIGQAIQAMQEATDQLDETAAAVAGLNRTDLRALSVLLRRGTLTIGVLGQAVGLSKGAMTTALDRLAGAGFVRRVAPGTDRRSIQVELTPRAYELAAEIWGPIAAGGAALLSVYSKQELELILEFLEKVRALQESHTERIRRMTDDPREC